MRKFFPVILLAISVSLQAQGPFCTLPSDYYDGLAKLSCNDLKTALFTKISATHIGQPNSALWSIFEKTDNHYNDENTQPIVWDMYTDRPNATGDCEFLFGTNQDAGLGGNAECQYFNKEHSMPNSWFGADALSYMYTDLFELYPTDKYLNNLHANYPYGEVNPGAGGVITSGNGSRFGPSAIAGIPGKVFEPIDEYKGDFARSFFYMATRYHDVIASWETFDPSGDVALDGLQYPSFEIPYLQMLLKWHHEDPVSKKETDRNNAIFCIQKNRNPYIDKPEYVDIVWNPSCPGAEALPVDIVFFKGVLAGTQVQLSWEIANEKNLKTYIVERSFNSKDFTPAGEVIAANRSHYNFKDDISKLTGRRIYYRLKQVDNDGHFKYSNIFSVHVPLNTLFTIYPNPVKDRMVLQLTRPVANATLIIVDMAGRTQLIQSLKQAAGNTSIGISQLAPGSYVVKVWYQDQQNQAKLEVIR